MAFIEGFRDLEVYQASMDACVEVFEITKGFPREEKFALPDQMRRASRSVCGNIAEAWRKRIYQAAFLSKLNDAEAEAAEMQVWAEIGLRCGFLDQDRFQTLDGTYDKIIGKLVRMSEQPDKWAIRNSR